MMDSFISKMKFKSPGLVVNCPEGLKNTFLDEGFGLGLDKSAKNENVIIFFLNKQEFDAQIDSILQVLQYDTVFWVAYPKGSSKISTDINRDILFNFS